MFIYRVDNLDKLKENGGFHNKFVKIGYSPSFDSDRTIPRLYFFKNEPEKLPGDFQTLEDYLLEGAWGGNLPERVFPIRFLALNKEYFLDKEWFDGQFAYYYQFNKDEPKKIIVSINNIEYYDKNTKEWIKII